MNTDTPGYIKQKSKHRDGNDQLDGNSDTATEHPRRRIRDSISAKSNTRKMNLDRRKTNYDRRNLKYSEYNGPARRLTVDRRMKTSDRRSSESEG